MSTVFNKKTLMTIAVVMLFILNTHLLLYASVCKCEDKNEHNEGNSTGEQHCSNFCCTNTHTSPFKSNDTQTGKHCKDKCASCSICLLRESVSYVPNQSSERIAPSPPGYANDTVPFLFDRFVLAALTAAQNFSPPSCPRNVFICLFLC